MQPKTTAIIAGLVLVAALAALWGRLGGSSQLKVDRALHTGLGQVLAQQAAAAVDDRGLVVAVLVDSYEQPDTVLHAQWQAFAVELRQHAAVSLAAPEILKPNTPFRLVEILERNPQARALVFFVNPPDWEQLAAMADRPSFPRVIAVGNPDLPAKNYYQRFFDRGILVALILPRAATASAPPPAARNPREWFDRYYQVYTTQNFESLP